MAQAAWFKLFGRHQAMFDAISNEQAGQVIKAAFAYLNTGELIELDPVSRVAFSALKADIDKSVADCQVICERNRANGQNGGRPPRKLSQISDTTDFEQKRESAIQSLFDYRQH